MVNRYFRRLSSPAAEALAHQITRILSTLAPREEMILRMRFGIGRKASTLEELSQQFSLTTALLRQIELRALRKVRREPDSSVPAPRRFSPRSAHQHWPSSANP